MSDNDAQALRDIRYFTGRLLAHADVLPLDLAAMIEEYQLDLGNASAGRWDGIGDPAQYADVARKISQGITDGEWVPGVCLDWSLSKRYCWGETRENVANALRLLAVRGELAVEYGKYYVR